MKIYEFFVVLMVYRISNR